jgi:UDP:flavonoid glycosyltransferase YjiC (YdhE family)
VVCHGGSGTSLATLAAGVPLLVIPLIADQPANARMVEQLGAGIAVTTEGDGTLRGLGPADVPRVRAAITALLTDGGYAAAAERVAQQLRRRATVPEVLAALRDPSG